jgi:hypothetical protein
MRKNGHKFNAVRTEIDGISFASKAEAKRYGELKMLEKAGEICCLELQPRFDLVVNDVSVGRYVADFRYKIPRACGHHKGVVVEDVKGFRTETYRLKKKLVEAQYGITITEITR